MNHSNVIMKTIRMVKGVRPNAGIVTMQKITRVKLF